MTAVPRLHREKLQELLTEIVRGQPPVGAMLPKEEALAERWQISRGVVRECLRAMEERGVVAVKHGRGATVAPLGEWNLLDPEVMRAVLAGPGAKALVSELIECRIAFEVPAARLAAERADGPQIRALKQSVARLLSLPRADRAGRAATEIGVHRLIVDAAGNRPMSRMISPVLDAMELLGLVLGRRPESHGELEAIVAAVAARDARAAGDAMQAHLEGVAEAMSRSRLHAVARSG